MGIEAKTVMIPTYTRRRGVRIYLPIFLQVVETPSFSLALPADISSGPPQRPPPTAIPRPLPHPAEAPARGTLRAPSRSACMTQSDAETSQDAETPQDAETLEGEAIQAARNAPPADPTTAAKALAEAQDRKRGTAPADAQSHTQPVYATQQTGGVFESRQNVHRDKSAILSEFDDPADNTVGD